MFTFLDIACWSDVKVLIIIQSGGCPVWCVCVFDVRVRRTKRGRKVQDGERQLV